MRLNPDCIRDVLIVVEDNSSFSKLVTLEDFSNSDIFQKYDMETISYHIRQAKESGLLLGATFYLGGEFTIQDLSPEGHKFLANIREDKNWTKTKAIATKVGSTSLNALASIATNVISTAINQHLGR
ncbi:DUF2513 domain-containing protein [Ligilactobacillus murinus]|uniref:DUF2513 domain-containing protein n=1 Tax=Ligilactobacillus murinus TaxID=1622 RepID=UPI00296ADCB3|nr:DUF2513 domain-containing protein [Ligilactobacillus murinus]WOY88151.1 DUF2513 domain-containing protein [Ligilactobacillus murinus]